MGGRMSRRADNIKSMCSYLSLVQRWCTAEELSLRLHTTTRTIRNYVHFVNAHAERPPIVSSPSGYRWSSTATTPSDERKRQNGLQTPRERIHQELASLLYHGAANVYDLAWDLSVSDYTLQNDLPHIRNVCRQFELSAPISHNLISIEGAEANKRLLCQHVILDLGNQGSISLDVVAQAFPDVKVARLCDNLAAVLTALDLTTDAFDFLDLLFHCSLQLSRFNLGHPLERGPSVNAPKASHMQEAASRLEAAISSQLKSPYTPAEHEHLTMLFYSFSHSAEPETWELSLDRYLYAQIYHSIDFLCSNVTLTHSRQHLARDIAIWAAHMVVRQKNRIPSSKPIYLRLRDSHATSFDLAVWLLSDMEEHCLGPLRQSQAEAASLAAIIIQHVDTYTWVPPKPQARLICPTSQDHAQEVADYLLKRLNHQCTFSEVSIGSHVNGTSKSADFTISTLPVKHDTPTAIISPFPTEQDIVAVSDCCANAIARRSIRMLGLYFNYYLDERLFCKNRQLRTKNEVLSHLCSSLESYDYTASKFRSQLDRREHIDDTAFHGFIALPHACTSSVKRNAIAVYQSDVPIEWGAQTVNLVILIAVEHGLLQDFYAIYESCIRFLSTPSHIVGLLEAATAQEFIRQIDRMVEDFT